MNNVSLIGRTTKDIEVQYAQAGMAVAKFSIAIGRTYTKDGEKVEEVSFIEIQCWGKTAENVAKYVSKGNKIAVSGTIKQDRWEDKESGTKRSKVYVVAQQVEFLESKPKENKTTDDNVTDDVEWDS